jgi:hypothetical protein
MMLMIEDGIFYSNGEKPACNIQFGCQAKKTEIHGISNTLNGLKMRRNQIQNYKNHIHYVPLYHYLTFAAMAVLVIGAIYNLITCNRSENLFAILFLLLVLTVISVSFHNRSFALKAQDRAVRAEENFRYFAITGKRLPEQLSLHQIISIRFAGDDELENLVEKVVRENLNPKQIKAVIINWKPDYHRA